MELVLGGPAHGGSCVGRWDGRAVFVRHGLPGERVRARITEDRGGRFCHADAVEILDPSPDRVPAVCPDAGPGGAGCCDLSHAALPAQRVLKATVVAEQLRRIAHVSPTVTVEPLAGSATGWRTRLRLAVDGAGRAGIRRYHSTTLATGLRCPQPVSGLLTDLSERRWQPHAELVVVRDGAGTRHLVELAPAPVSRTGRRSPGRRGATSRRAAAGAVRAERVLAGSGRVHEHVAGRSWEFAATGFWQAHQEAAQRYSDLIGEWADLGPGATAWDLYSGVGVFAARLAEQVGMSGTVVAVDSAESAVAAGAAALADLGQLRFVAGRADRRLAELPDPDVVVLDPPRSGAGADVVAAIAARRPARIVHVGCDPAAFARDVADYRSAGYELDLLRAYDAFPLTHHVEVIGRFRPVS
ncbi:TRAM domain-containing protein [Skermania piniformis]